jgi:hypothetical protein
MRCTPLPYCRSVGDAPAFVEIGEAGIAVDHAMRRFNVLGDELLGSVSDKCSSEDGELLVGLQSTEALGRLHHSSSRPAQRHRGISPALHVATDPPHGPHHILDRVGAGKRTPELGWQSEAIDSQHLIEPFKDAGGDTGARRHRHHGQPRQPQVGRPPPHDPSGRRNALVSAALFARSQPDRTGLHQGQALDANRPEAHHGGHVAAHRQPHRNHPTQRMQQLLR